MVCEIPRTQLVEGRYLRSANPYSVNRHPCPTAKSTPLLMPNPWLGNLAIAGNALEFCLVYDFNTHQISAYLVCLQCKSSRVSDSSLLDQEESRTSDFTAITRANRFGNVSPLCLVNVPSKVKQLLQSVNKKRQTNNIHRNGQHVVFPSLKNEKSEGESVSWKSFP